jgi:hypothetical protein
MRRETQRDTWLHDLLLHRLNYTETDYGLVQTGLKYSGFSHITQKNQSMTITEVDVAKFTVCCKAGAKRYDEVHNPTKFIS